MAFFSIITPVYNTEKFLSRCINSVLSQTYTDFEMIIVNDASPGNCKDIVNSYSDHRIHYIENKLNKGTHATRKRGIREAKSNYTLFLDSDDYIASHCLESLKNRLIGNDIDQLEYGYITVPYNIKNQFNFLYNKSSILEQCLQNNQVYRNFSLCNKATKTSILKKAFSLTEDFYCIWFEDGYEQFIINSLSSNFDSIEQYLLFIDETSGITTTFESLSESKFKIRVENVKQVVDALYKFTENENYSKYRSLLPSIYYEHSKYLLYKYYPTIKNNEKSKAMREMLENFPEELMNEYINNLLKNQKTLKPSLIKRIGRKIKHICHIK